MQHYSSFKGLKKLSKDKPIIKKQRWVQLRLIILSNNNEACNNNC